MEYCITWCCLICLNLAIIVYLMLIVLWVGLRCWFVCFTSVCWVGSIAVCFAVDCWRLVSGWLIIVCYLLTIWVDCLCFDSFSFVWFFIGWVVVQLVLLAGFGVCTMLLGLLGFVLLGVYCCFNDCLGVTGCWLHLLASCGFGFRGVYFTMGWLLVWLCLIDWIAGVICCVIVSCYGLSFMLCYY